MKNYRVKAGALQMTLFISIVIALLLAACVVFVSVYKRFKIDSNFLIETVKSSQNQIDYALVNSIAINDSLIIDEDNDKTSKIYRDFWGAFEKVTVQTAIKSKAFKRAALLGGFESSINRPALFLEDHNKPLVLVGNTRIEGTTYLSKQGVKPGNIAGQSYYGDRLIYGAIKSSKKTLPKLNSDFLSQINKTINSNMSLDDKHMITLHTGLSVSNSFFKPTQYIYDINTINLNNITLTGNIMIISKHKIIVSQTAKLKDVILIAPHIEIQNNVKGYFQALASKRIVVGKDSELSYPSALLVQEKKQNASVTSQTLSESRILIDADTSVAGIVAFLGASKTNTKPQITIEENATIHGEVYCNQNTELKGVVHGSVFTSNFLIQKSGSIYQNHIYNGRIIANNLANEYVGFQFLNSKKDILKWLY